MLRDNLQLLQDVTKPELGLNIVNWTRQDKNHSFQSRRATIAMLPFVALIGSINIRPYPAAKEISVQSSEAHRNCILYIFYL